jgi:hypothetical protein
VKQSMNKLVSIGQAFALATAIGVVSTTASAQMPPPPPPEFVVTAEPVYYEGHAAYWYQNHWYYRDEHGAWAYYHDEPKFLSDHRRAAPPERHSYAPARRDPPRVEPGHGAPAPGGDHRR